MKDSYVFYKDKLNEEYLPVFDQVEMYLITQTIDEPAREDRLSELLDIFLSAQEAGKSVRSVTGNNMEQFCKAFCADFGVKNALLNVLDSLKRFAWLFVVLSAIDIVWLLFDTETAGQSIWTVKSTLNIPAYFIAVIIVDALCAVTNFFLRRAMFRARRVSMKVLKAVLCVEVVVAFIGVFSIVTAGLPRLFDCPTWVVLAIAAAYLLVYYPTRGRQAKREKVKFFDMVKEEADRSFPAEMEKKFAKAQKRALKRGRELTLEQFLDKEEKDCNTTERLKYFYFLLPIPIIGIPFVQMLLSGGFDSPLDAVLFVVIQSVIEYALMLGLWKIVKSALPGRRAWIAAKREELKQ